MPAVENSSTKQHKRDNDLIPLSVLQPAIIIATHP